MAKYTKDTKKNTYLHQQMPVQNITPEVVRQCIQYYTFEMDQISTHRKCNKEEKMAEDRTHIQVTSRNHRPPPSLHQDRDGEDGAPWSMAYALSAQTVISR